VAIMLPPQPSASRCVWRAAKCAPDPGRRRYGCGAKPRPLPVDAARDDTALFPKLLAFLRGAYHRGDFTTLLTELGNIQVSQVVGDLLRERFSIGIL